MKRFAGTFAIALLFIVLGCVIRTEHKIDAHITLDIRHVEEEVGGVFDYVEGSTDELPDITSQSGEQPTSWLHRVGDALCPVRIAYAKEPDTSPLVEEIAESMRKRYPKIAKWKASECLGENNQGYVELRDLDALKDDENRVALEKELKELVKEDNKDRKALYKELARLRKLDVATLEGVGAKDKLKRAKKDEWVQLPGPGEEFDAFKVSKRGKELDDDCKPNTWVQMP